MLSGLLGTPAAVAAEAPTALPTGVRAQIVTYWETGGAGLKLAAEQALLGGDEAVQKFLDEAPAIQFDDNRVDVARLAMTGGPGLRQASKEAIRKTPAELEEFLLYGYEDPLDEDRRVDIARVINFGGPGVQEAGKAALQGTFDDRELFLNKGQYEAQEDDNRVEVARLATSGGPNVRAAAKVALRGTPDDIVEFLDVGQFIARNRDQEHASIAELIEQAERSGKQAEDATKKAEEAAKKAVESSALAKEAALNAAAEAKAAKDDSKKAAVKAKQAADAARGAAAAAQEAIGAADAASNAARRAALAAMQTSSASAAAANAANNAHEAAIAAAHDEAYADGANKAAGEARAAAKAAEKSGLAAEQAGRASAAAALASGAAKSASGNARAAADAADEANDYADAAGAHSQEARQAAAEARRHADAADRAADRSAALALRAASAAYGARDAANSAARHANKAADYAEDAAKHAGDATRYAETAQKNADAAKVAADAATAAVTKAKETFALARETEDAGLETRTDAAIERARSMKAASDAAISESAAAQLKALSLDGTATELAKEAARPDVDVKATAAKGRELAMHAMQMLGSWHQEAAARALSGTDQDVLDYLRTRWKEANHNDVRQRVVELSTQSPYATVRTAATEALKGTPEQIEAFYRTGQYGFGLDDMKVNVARLASTGGPSVSKAAKASLADGTGKALATFLHIGQYGERLTDEKVIVAERANNGGAEVKAAAKVALAGPPELVHEFVTTGQYMAQRQNNLTSTHVHQVKSLLAEGDMIAAKAHENAWRAVRAAALARKAAAEADDAKNRADKSAADANKYAADADASANNAEQSAADAAASASTARDAADRADVDATAAENSAADAEFSAAYARDSAQKAQASADAAKQSALNAGKSAAEAETAAKAAWQKTRELAEKEREAARKAAEDERKAQEGEPEKTCVRNPYFPVPCQFWVLGSIEKLTQPSTIRAIVWEMSGLGDIQACIDNPTATGCIMAVVGVTPWGKFKLLTKIDNGVDALKGTRAARRTLACLTGAAHSFPAGTNVLMADGTSRPIEQIQTGDSVTATDPTTHETGSRTVTRTIHTPDDRNFTDVTLADGSTLTSTSHHPYWSQNDQEWKNASDLEAGDTLRTPQNSTAAIAHTRDWQGLQDAYDLTVDDLHTYYVTTGTTNVLVHNNDEACPVWVKNAWDQLPLEGSVTSGYVFTSDGKKLWQTPVESGRTATTEEISRFLQGSPDYPYIPGYSPLAHHAEVKAAWEMRNKGAVGDVLHIVINKNYLCPKVTDAVQVGCRQSVPAVLYEDQVLCVWVPGSSKAVPLPGKVKRPGSTWSPPGGNRCAS
jgi:hypothetical protein